MRAQNLIDLLIVEESDLPVLMTEILREVFEVGGLVSLDVIQGNKLTLLLIRELVDQYLGKYVLNCRIAILLVFR